MTTITKNNSRNRPDKIETGMKFGMLTVRGEAPRKAGEKNKRYTCLCECGGITKPRGCDLRDGSSSSCGCKRGRAPGTKPKGVFSGDRFHRLKVISTEYRDKILFCLCQCDCGQKVEVRSGNLKSGNTKSCGCLAKSSAILTQPKPVAASAKSAWNAVKVTAPDGNTWIVGRTKVEDDYAAFLVHADGLTLGHATEKVRSGETDFWFTEQYVLDEVMRDGTLIARPTYEQITAPDYDRTTELHQCEYEFITL